MFTIIVDNVSEGNQGIVSDMVDVYNGDQQSTSPIDQLPNGLLLAILSAGDRLVEKSSSLIGDTTTNITENFLSVRSAFWGVFGHANHEISRLVSLIATLASI